MKRFGIWFQNLTRFQQIGALVLSVHFVIFLALFLNHISTPNFERNKPIAIRTTVLPTIEPPRPPPASLAKKKPQVLPPKKAESTLGLKAETKKKSTAAAEKKEREEERAILNEIAESLGFLAASTKVPKEPNLGLVLPTEIQMQPQDLSSKETPNYREIVSATLQKNLDLPEFGKVVVKIEIDAVGNVTDCLILDSQSRKNEDFLKKRLQQLRFPCFNQFGIKEDRLNFTVTFQNVENF